MSAWVKVDIPTASGNVRFTDLVKSLNKPGANVHRT
jgi:hypothetical protein